MIGKRFEKNNLTFAFNISYAKEGQICPAYISKHNSNFQKHVTVIMIRNGEKYQ